MSEEITHQFPKDGFNQILARFDSIDTQFTTFNFRMGALEDRMGALEDRMGALEEKVDRRLMETRPIWEQVLVRLDAIEARLDRVESRLDAIELRLDRIEGEQHDQNRKFRVYLKDFVRLQDDQEDLDERVEKLESTPTVKA